MKESDLNKLRVNFNLDVLRGCKWKCVGCYAQKNGQDGFLEGDLERFSALADSFVARAMVPSILILGPTDIFSASNGLDLLTDPMFVKLAGKFERLALTATFLELSEDVLDALADNFSRLEIEFKILVDLPYFNDDRHLDQARTNMERASRRLSRCAKFVVHPQLNLFNAPTRELRQVLTDYRNINERSHAYFGQGVDYAVSFGRTPIPKSYQRRAFQLLKDTFNQHVKTREDGRNLHFDAGRMDDIQENIFTYRNGEFFFAPKLYDEYVNYEDRYKINVSAWSADEFIDYQRELTLKQYARLSEYPCETCAYAGNCVSKGVVDFLDFLGSKQCIFPREAFKAINIGIEDGNPYEAPL